MGGARGRQIAFDRVGDLAQAVQREAGLEAFAVPALHQPSGGVVEELKDDVAGGVGDDVRRDRWGRDRVQIAGLLADPAAAVIFELGDEVLGVHRILDAAGGVVEGPRDPVDCRIGGDPVDHVGPCGVGRRGPGAGIDGGGGDVAIAVIGVGRDVSCGVDAVGEAVGAVVEAIAYPVVGDLEAGTVDLGPYRRIDIGAVGLGGERSRVLDRLDDVAGAVDDIFGGPVEPVDGEAQSARVVVDIVGDDVARSLRRGQPGDDIGLGEAPADRRGRELAGVGVGAGDAPFAVVEGAGDAKLRIDRPGDSVLPVVSVARNAGRGVVHPQQVADPVVGVDGAQVEAGGIDRGLA